MQYDLRIGGEQDSKGGKWQRMLGAALLASVAASCSGNDTWKWVDVDINDRRTRYLMFGVEFLLVETRDSMPGVFDWSQCESGAKQVRRQCLDRAIREPATLLVVLANEHVQHHDKGKRTPHVPSVVSVTLFMDDEQDRSDFASGVAWEGDDLHEAAAMMFRTSGEHWLSQQGELQAQLRKSEAFKRCTEVEQILAQLVAKDTARSHQLNQFLRLIQISLGGLGSADSIYATSRAHLSNSRLLCARSKYELGVTLIATPTPLNPLLSFNAAADTFRVRVPRRDVPVYRLVLIMPAP